MKANWKILIINKVVNFRFPIWKSSYAFLSCIDEVHTCFRCVPAAAHLRRETSKTRGAWQLRTRTEDRIISKNFILELLNYYGNCSAAYTVYGRGQDRRYRHNFRVDHYGWTIQIDFLICHYPLYFVTLLLTVHSSTAARIQSYFWWDCRMTSFKYGEIKVQPATDVYCTNWMKSKHCRGGWEFINYIWLW